MNTRIPSLSTAILLLAAGWLHANPVSAPPSPSPEFERMKSLVGTWKGTTDMGQGPVEMTLQYRLLAGGTVLEERSFARTPNEMVTMYYDKDGRLALTHYCVLGNRPGMILKSSDAETLKFAFDPTCGIDPVKDSHMNALTLRFEDARTIVAVCEAVLDGTRTPGHATTLHRVDS